MARMAIAAAALTAAICLAPAAAGAATYTVQPAFAGALATDVGDAAVVKVQDRRGGGYDRGRRGGGYERRGGPRWGYRAWGRRPYYGTIIGGIALGTIIGVTAYGLAPPRPSPDLCWFWADESESRGYWDYCPR